MISQLHPSRSSIGAACAYAMAHRDPALVPALLGTVAARVAAPVPRAALLACLYLVDALFKRECEADGAAPAPGSFRAPESARPVLAALAAAAPPAETRRVLAIWQDKAVVPAALCAHAAARLAARSAAPPDSADDLAGLLSSPTSSSPPPGTAAASAAPAPSAPDAERYRAQLERVQREFRAAQAHFERGLSVPAALARLHAAQTRFFYALWSTVPAAVAPALRPTHDIRHGVCRPRDREAAALAGSPGTRPHAAEDARRDGAR